MFSNTDNTALKSELDGYLDTPCVETDSPLSWWMDNCSTYSRLFQMAQDFLVIPGMYLLLEYNAHARVTTTMDYTIRIDISENHYILLKVSIVL
jgi:hAT family C-terminal dimerisation region